MNDKNAPGVKYDQGKPRPELLDPGFILEVSDVLMLGAQKYADDNWKKVPGSKLRYIGAALRHMLAYMSGQVLDEETNKSHLAHCTCCLMFLFWHDQQ